MINISQLNILHISGKYTGLYKYGSVSDMAFLLALSSGLIL